MKKKLEIYYRNKSDGEHAPLLHATTLDELIWSGVYELIFAHDDASLGLPFRFDDNEKATLLVEDNNNEGIMQGTRKVVQRLSFIERTTCTLATYIRTRCNCDGKCDWGEWSILDGASTQMLQDGSVTVQKLNSDLQERINKSANGAYWTSGHNAVTLNINKNDGTVGWQTLHAATTEKAGVMSADDKKSIIAHDKVAIEKHTLSGLFATASPKILNTESSAYKIDYIPIQNGDEYYINAVNLSLVNNWVQIGTTTEIPAANVAIKNIAKYMNSTDRNVDMVYKSDIDGYLVCFYQGEQGYLFEKTVFRHIVPILTEKVEAIENTVSSYNDAIYEREDVALAETVLSTLFLTGASTTILQTTDTSYQLAYAKVEKGKVYRVINYNCTYQKGWAIVSYTTQVPAKGVPVTLLAFAEANTSAIIDYSYTPLKDGYLCATYQTSGADSKIYESCITTTPATTVLKNKVAALETLSVKSSIILPSKFFAVVGYEFNIYWDAIYMTPDYGAGCPNFMVQAVCGIGANYQRSYRVTPTASQTGEYEITIQVYGVNGGLIDEKKSTLVVINPSAITISNPKNILSLGDSTIDDTGYMIKNLYSSIADLGFGNKILPIGTRGFVGSRHEARTGYTYKGYLTTYKTCKIYVSNLSEIVASVNELNVFPHPVFKNPNNSSRIWISDINVAEGWMTADNNALTDGWSGTLQSYNNNVVNIDAVVTNVVNNVDNIVLYNNNTVDFANYMASVYGDSDKTIDVLTMANGINDCRGALKNQGQIDTIVDNAKAIIDAFLSYNPNGKVLIALPKIKASTIIEVYPSTYTLNSYNLRKKINEVFSSYDERVIVFGEVCGMDRFWGYPISQRAVAARIPETITYNGDAVHPRNEGYLQIADTYLGALLYACKD